jgi:hypothetical protein
MIDDCELMLMIQVQGVPEAQVEAEVSRAICLNIFFLI